MHISCVICSELFVAASDVFATGCGHLFHYACLIQWIERSKSCPQCRNKTTEETIHRVYFNVGSSLLEEDTSVLRKKIDSLEFQIHLKDTDIKNATGENHTLKSQNKELREAITTMEFNIAKLEFAVSVLKNLITCLEEQILVGEDTRKAAKERGRQLDKLKREMQAATDQKQNLKVQLRTCRLDLSAANLEKEKLNEEINLKSQLNKQLEDDLQHLEHENRSLQKKVYDLEKTISSPSGRNPRDSVLQRLLMKRPIPEAVRRPKLTDAAEGNSFTSTMFGNLLSPESKPYCQSEPHSPYLNIKSHSFGLTPLKGSQTVTQSLPSVGSKFSIFNKPPCTLMASSVATNPAHLPTVSNKFSIFNKPPCTLMASSVATNPEAAHDGAFPIPSPKFKPPQRKLKYSGTSKPKKKVTVSYK